MAEIAIVADDLSGAVEAAAAFLSRTSRIDVILSKSFRPQASPVVTVADTDSRHIEPAAAARRVTAAFDAVRDVPIVLKKVDSLLRGNLVAELVAARSVRANMIVATALPAAGRTVRNAVVHLGGRPIGDTDAWRAEARTGHATVLDALAPLPGVSIDLEAVRSNGLAGKLLRALEEGKLPVCDAVTDEDLDNIVAASRAVQKPVLVGSAGLASAVARAMDSESDPAVHRLLGGKSVLVVVGSAAAGISAQIQALTSLRPAIVLVQPNELLGETPTNGVTERIEMASSAVKVVAIDPTAQVDPMRSRILVQALAKAVTPAAHSAAALLLTGGETARLVLDRLGVPSLQPLFSVHHGAVVCAGPDGQLIATRPGSFGGPESLLDIVRALQDAHIHLSKEPV
jgi:D-threonate/D-erythronate kinase